jgi:hypothetical protein
MSTMEPITLLVAALGTARLTRLITRDRITHAPRRWVLQRLDQDGLTAYMIVCDWCVSVYTGAAIAAVGAWNGLWSWGWAVPLTLAFSLTTGWLASKEGE